MLMSAVTTGAWSLPGSRLAVRAFLSPRIDELSRKTWQHRGGGGGRVLWGLAGLLLYFLFVETLIVFQEKKRADRSDWIFKYQRVPFSSPPHYSMSPGSLFFFLLSSPVLLIHSSSSVFSSVVPPLSPPIPLRPLPCDSLFGRYCDITFTHRPLLSSPPLPARC